MALYRPAMRKVLLNIAVYRITTSGSFNLATWTGTGGVPYTVSANAGVLSSTLPGGSAY